MKIKLAVVVTVLLFASLYAADTLYSGMDDKTDRLSNDQAGIFSPGYINAAMQKTREIINQANQYKSPIEYNSELVKDDLSSDVMEDSVNAVTPELKKKTGSAGESQKTPVATESANLISDSSLGDIKIGSGTPQITENGRLISEVINGKCYVYVGFDNVGKGTITAAIALAKQGDTVIVKAKDGGYQEGASLYIKNGVNLLGGYNEEGVRNFQALTSINGVLRANNITNQTEISGFKIDGGNSYYSAEMRSSNILFANNYVINSSIYRGRGTVSIIGEYTGSGRTTSVTLKNNVFDVGISVSMVGGGYPSIGGGKITSMDNNYLGSSGITIFGMLTNESIQTRSTNDYFMSGIDASTAMRMSFTNQRQTMDSGGLIKIATTPSVQTSPAISAGISTELLNSRSYNSLNNAYSYSLADKTGKTMDSAMLTTIFKGLLTNAGVLQGGNQGEVDPKVLAKAVSNALQESALALPVANLTQQEMEIASILASIIRNPTSDQKMILDAVTALLKEVNKQEQEGSASPELKKTQDDLLQMVASVLIAQAIPDLLKEGDVSNIKGIFASLNSEKTRIVLEYQESTRPYYDEIAKELSKNMSLLQLKNILSNSITKEELEKLPPIELAKIMEKLHQAKDKSFEEEYILQQEAKYRKAYIDPNKKILEEKMKGMMRDFTQRLSKILESTKK